MKKIAAWIERALSDVEDRELHKTIRLEVKEMAQQFPHFTWEY